MASSPSSILPMMKGGGSTIKTYVELDFTNKAEERSQSQSIPKVYKQLNFNEMEILHCIKRDRNQQHQPFAKYKYNFHVAIKHYQDLSLIDHIYVYMDFFPSVNIMKKIFC